MTKKESRPVKAASQRRGERAGGNPSRCSGQRVRILFDERGEVAEYELRDPDRTLFVIAELATALLEDLNLIAIPREMCLRRKR